MPPSAAVTAVAPAGAGRGQRGRPGHPARRPACATSCATPRAARQQRLDPGEPAGQRRAGALTTIALPAGKPERAGHGFETTASAPAMPTVPNAPTVSFSLARPGHGDPAVQRELVQPAHRVGERDAAAGDVRHRAVRCAVGRAANERNALGSTPSTGRAPVHPDRRRVQRLRGRHAGQPRDRGPHGRVQRGRRDHEQVRSRSLPSGLTCTAVCTAGWAEVDAAGCAPLGTAMGGAPGIEISRTPVPGLTPAGRGGAGRAGGEGRSRGEDGAAARDRTQPEGRRAAPDRLPGQLSPRLYAPDRLQATCSLAHRHSPQHAARGPTRLPSSRHDARPVRATVCGIPQNTRPYAQPRESHSRPSGNGPARPGHAAEARLTWPPSADQREWSDGSDALDGPRPAVSISGSAAPRLLHDRPTIWRLRRPGSHGSVLDGAEASVRRGWCDQRSGAARGAEVPPGGAGVTSVRRRLPNGTPPAGPA